MKKGFLTSTFTSIITIISMIFIIYLLVSNAQMNIESYSTATMELGKFFIFNRIVTSRNCTSTGETGILNKTLLDDAHALGEELECVYLPDYAHFVQVDDLTNGEGWDWTFGYRGTGKWRDKFESYVSIIDGDNVIPAFLSVTVIAQGTTKDQTGNTDKDEGLICLTRGVEMAWKDGDSKTSCYINVAYDASATQKIRVHFKQNPGKDEICLERNNDGSVIRCRKLREGINLQEYTGLFWLHQVVVEFEKDETAVPPIVNIKSFEQK